MTVKEIEQESGMTRANIRYYEAEGLLTPIRGANKYRDYSEEDLETLKKIKLLRSLHFSLEEIKALQSGSRELSEALDRQLVRLQQEKKQIEHSQELCRVMRDDGVRYKTLDAQRYLGILEQGGMPTLPEQDALAEVRAPWRRYFARWMDLLIYTVVWNVFLALVLGVNVFMLMRSAGGCILDNIVTTLLMFLVEPVLLHLFGTTPGKWILGLRVTDNEGKRLSMEEARSRTWKMLLYGMGLGIPIWNQIRLWKSFRGCMEEETQEWEYHSAVTLKDERGWRIAAYFGAVVLLCVVHAFAYSASALPKNRGDITVAQFSQNYNHYSKFYGCVSKYYLDSEGQWIEDRSQGNVIIGPPVEHEQPTFQFLETDGIMTGVSFSVTSRGGGERVSGYRDEMILSMLAFAGAQKEYDIFAKEMTKAVKAVGEASFESFELSVRGVRVTCEAAYSGYMEAADMLIPVEGEERWYSLSFSMVKNEG